MLLQDIRAILEDARGTKIHSITLVDELIKLEERPWCEWKKGKPITQNSLAKILKTFSIKSKYVRAGVLEKNSRGFEFTQFDDAFNRYIPDNSIQSVTVLQCCKAVVPRA